MNELQIGDLCKTYTFRNLKKIYSYGVIIDILYAGRSNRVFYLIRLTNNKRVNRTEREVKKINFIKIKFL